MKRILITFGGRAWDGTLERIVEARGVDRVLVYDDVWLMQADFYRQNIEWWSKPDVKYGLVNRGFGWFIWKPYVMRHALANAEPGDIVLYTDADTYPIADLSPLFAETERNGGIMLFHEMGCTHSRWCKRDCFIQMGQDHPLYRDVRHGCARFYAFRKGNYTGAALLEDWQRFCLEPLCNTFDDSVLAPEHPEFYEHRCEQAILTNLAYRHGLKLYRTACQAGALQPEDQEIYPQMFEQVDCPKDKRDLSGSKWRNVDA